MSDHINLLGSEEVMRAACQMVSAAQDMRRAADNAESTLFQNQRFMSDWLGRFEQVLNDFAARVIVSQEGGGTRAVVVDDDVIGTENDDA